MKLLKFNEFVFLFKNSEYSSLSQFTYISFNGQEISIKDFLIKSSVHPLSKDEYKFFKNFISFVPFELSNKSTMELIKSNISDINKNANGVKIFLKESSHKVDLS